jgi:manganese transport protein
VNNATPTTTRVRPRRQVTLAELQERSGLRRRLGLLGPAFVAAVAYLDPGNFVTNFAAGASSGYRLLWVVAGAILIAMLVQYVTSKVGLVTGRSLPELCHDRYSRRANILLWTQAEVVAMSTDLAEFTGAALGLHFLLGLGLLPAGGVTAVTAFGILALEQRGYRPFELAVASLLSLVGLGIAYLFFTIGATSYAQAGAGLLPHLDGGTATLAAGIVGATVMPHVIYLHSALQKDRVTAADARGTRMLLAFNRLDCVLALGAAGLVNMAMLGVAAAVFHVPGQSAPGGLGGIYAGLAERVGGGAALAFAVALMASGLSSSSVGTYAGQVVMAGFTGWRIPIWIRRALTMLPSLLVLALASNISQALVWSQVILSFGIPCALIPLLIIGRDHAVLGSSANRQVTTVLLTVITVLIVALNALVVWQTLGGLG